VHVNLGNTFLDTNELEIARAHFEAALRSAPNQPEAHQGLSYVFARLGDEAAAARHRELGFRDRAIAVFPYRGQVAPKRALLLVSASGGNVFTTDFLDDRVYATTRIFCEYFPETEPLPPHDIVFNAIGDAERCADALTKAASMLDRSSVPVVNAPAKVARTGRVAVMDLLRGIDGLRVPRVSKEARARAGAGLTCFPVLVRAPGYHTGMHFLRVDDAEDLAGALATLPDGDVLRIEYLDARGDDGLYRKYRVMLVDGRLYPLHLAIGTDWKVHYFTSAMAGDPEHQEEERAFLGDMEGVLGTRAITALREIQQRLGLDYAGVDFGLDAAGNVLLFEANATMVVPSREVNPELAYRVPHFERVIEAVRLMLRRKL